MFNEYRTLSTELYQFTKPVGFSILGDLEYYYEILKDIKGNILEAGVGTGRVLIPYLKKGLKIEGVDLSESMINMCKYNLTQANVNTNLYCADIVTMDLKKTYDCVFMISGSFALITDYDLGIKALKNFKKHLKTGGRLVLDLILPENFRENTSYSELFKINNKRAIFFTQYYENIDYKSQVIHQLNRYELWENNSLKTSELSRFDLKWYGIEEFVNILKSLGFKDISYEFGYGKDGASSLVSFSCTKK